MSEIGRFIARDKPGAARRWVGRLQRKAREAITAPRVGRRVPELGRDDVRELLLRSYRIVYRIRESEIRVLTVFEGHRQFPADVLEDLQPLEDE